MTEQDQAILAFVKLNWRTVSFAAVTAVIMLFVWSHWHTRYICNDAPTTIGVLACHLS